MLRHEVGRAGEGGGQGEHDGEGHATASSPSFARWGWSLPHCRWGTGEYCYPRVATRIALIVWRRFSAWSNTMLAPDSKTSPVTSRPEVMPVCSMISRPTVVLGSWNAGRQCMNLTFGLPLLPSSAVLTW